MDITLQNRAVKLTLKLALGAIAFLFLHAPSAQAQDCCPDADQYNQAKTPRAHLSATNPRRAKRILASKLQAAATPGMQPPPKERSNRSARVFALKQPE